jgi:hypothetical protein
MASIAAAMFWVAALICSGGFRLRPAAGQRLFQQNPEFFSAPRHPAPGQYGEQRGQERCASRYPKHNKLDIHPHILINRARVAAEEHR